MEGYILRGIGSWSYCLSGSRFSQNPSLGELDEGDIHNDPTVYRTLVSGISRGVGLGTRM